MSSTWNSFSAHLSKPYLVVAPFKAEPHNTTLCNTYRYGIGRPTVFLLDFCELLLPFIFVSWGLVTVNFPLQLLW